MSLLEYKIFVSSANNTDSSLSDTLAISFMYILNKMGPKTDPYGTPHMPLFTNELELNNDTYWDRSEIYDLRKSPDTLKPY